MSEILQPFVSQSRIQLEETKRRLHEWGRNIAAKRTLHAHTRISMSREARARYRGLVAAGGVALGYANHQAHTDGMAFASDAEYLRKLSRVKGRRPAIGGFAVPFAVTMASGDQSEELTGRYDLLKNAAIEMGATGVTVTREKDEEVYGKKKDLTELRPLISMVRAGWGILSLPEASVQGGRHPVGAGIDEIFGMQKVTNNALTGYFELMKRVLGKQGKFPFFQPIGLHGSYRIMQSMEGDPPKPKFTEEGKRSLKIGVILGTPLLGAIPGIPLLRIQSNILMPYTEQEVAADLGSDWLQNPSIFNEYAMRRVALGVPEVARGIYALKT